MTNTLYDITDLIVVEENKWFFNEEEHIELYQMCLHLMDEFINENPTIITEPEFEEFFDEDICEIVHLHFDFDIFYNDDAEEEMDDIIEQAKSDFFNIYYVPDLTGNNYFTRTQFQLCGKTNKYIKK